MNTRTPRTCETINGYRYIEYDCDLCGAKLDRNFYCSCFRPRSMARLIEEEDWQAIEKRCQEMLETIEKYRSARGKE